MVIIVDIRTAYRGVEAVHVAHVFKERRHFPNSHFVGLEFESLPDFLVLCDPIDVDFDFRFRFLAVRVGESERNRFHEAQHEDRVYCDFVHLRAIVKPIIVLILQHQKRDQKHWYNSFLPQHNHKQVACHLHEPPQNNHFSVH